LKKKVSSSDNKEIAGLKFKFGPMLKVNRMGAKSEEMKEAKTIRLSLFILKDGGLLNMDNLG
jgi:hypothetical protein